MLDTIRGVKYESNTLVNGYKLRSIFFVSGCNHKCPGCHNEVAHDYNAGRDFYITELYDLIMADMVINHGVTYSGGEPFDKAKELTILSMMLKEKGVNIWSYTGYTYEQIIQDEDKRNLLNYIDVLVDGRFVQELVSGDHRYRGSSNQRLIDVPTSLKLGQIVLWEVPSS